MRSCDLSDIVDERRKTIRDNEHAPTPSSASGLEDPAPSFLRTRSFLVLALCAAPIFFFQLGAGSIANSDDAFYAWSVRQAEREGSLLAYRWNNARLDFRYPSVHFLMLRASTATFGHNSFGLRLPGALGGFFSALLLAALVNRLTRSPTTGLFAGLLLCASGVLYLSARSARIDATLAAVSLAAIWAYLRAWQKPNWLYAASVLAGLAVLTKGIIGLLVFFPIAFDLLTRREFSRGMLLKAAAIFVVVAGSWHGYQLAKHGGAFIDTYVIYTIFTRVKGIAGLATPEPISTLLFRSESALLLAYLIGAAWVVYRARDDRVARLLLVWSLTALLPLIASSTRLPHYFVPAVAPLCAACALALKKHLGRAVLVVAAVAFALGIFLVNNIANWLNPDFTPGLQQIVALAKPGAKRLVVFNHYHAAAEYYADLPTTLVTDDQRAHRLLTSVRAMQEGATVELVAPNRVPSRIESDQPIRWLTTALFEKRLRRYAALLPRASQKRLRFVRLGPYVLLTDAAAVVKK